jgi:hypothetical protein
MPNVLLLIIERLYRHDVHCHLHAVLTAAEKHVLIRLVLFPINGGDYVVCNGYG